MANGIKISELNSTKTPTESSQIVIVEATANGLITKKTTLKDVRELFGGSENMINNRIAIVSGNVKTLSENIGTINSRLEGYDQDIYQLKKNKVNIRDYSDFTSEFYTFKNTTQENTESISAKVNVLSAFDDNTISSLKEVVELLSGDDGEIALANITDKIGSVCADVELLKTDVQNQLNIIGDLSDAVADIVENDAVKAYNDYENVSISAVLNSEYDYYFDPIRFKNIELPFTYISSWMYSLQKSGDTNQIEYSFNSKQTGQNVVINEVTYQIIGLISAEGLSIDVDNKKYHVSCDDNEEFSIVSELGYDNGIRSDYGMLPLRVGMLNREIDYVTNQPFYRLKTKVLGNSDVEVFLNNAKILTIDSDMILQNDGKTVCLKKSTSNEANLYDLQEAFSSSKVPGGTTIDFLITSDGDIGRASLVEDEHTIFGAIRAVPHPSETKKLELNVLSTFNGTYGDVSKTVVQYITKGGATGEDFLVSAVCNRSSTAIDTSRELSDVVSNSDITVITGWWDNVAEIDYSKLRIDNMQWPKPIHDLVLNTTVTAGYLELFLVTYDMFGKTVWSNSYTPSYLATTAED